jgi:hypothetical protein
MKQVMRFWLIKVRFWGARDRVPGWDDDRYLHALVQIANQYREGGQRERL